jgi:hypothetical protein
MTVSSARDEAGVCRKGIPEVRLDQITAHNEFVANSAHGET